MPLPAVPVIVKTAKLVWSIGSWAYALIDEFRHEKKQETLEEQRARRVMAERYSEASKSAGPSSGKGSK
jgi:hypothetical protein